MQSLHHTRGAWYHRAHSEASGPLPRPATGEHRTPQPGRPAPRASWCSAEAYITPPSARAPTLRVDGAAAPRRAGRRQPKPRGRAGPGRPATPRPRTRCCFPPRAASAGSSSSCAGAHKDTETETGSRQRCIYSRSAPPRASHRGAFSRLVGLRLLLLVLRFHGREEKHLLRKGTPSVGATAAPPSPPPRPGERDPTGKSRESAPRPGAPGAALVAHGAALAEARGRALPRRAPRLQAVKISKQAQERRAFLRWNASS